MRLIGLALVALLALGGGAFAKDWSKIRIGVEGAYPPFSSVTPEGKLVGFDIDIAEALCRQLKAECQLVQQDWDGIIPALLAKKYDAIVASMSITEERKKRVAFTERYQSPGASFVAKKGSGITVTPTSIEAPGGTVRVGVQRATIHDKFVSEVLGSKAEIVRYGTQDEANLDLVAGRVDLVLADTTVLKIGFLATKDGAGFEIVGPQLSDPRWFGEGAGIALRQDDTDLKAKLDAALAAIKASGEHKALQIKYFGEQVFFF